MVACPSIFWRHYIGKQPEGASISRSVELSEAVQQAATRCGDRQQARLFFGDIVLYCQLAGARSSMPFYFSAELQYTVDQFISQWASLFLSGTHYVGGRWGITFKVLR